MTCFHSTWCVLHVNILNLLLIAIQNVCKWIITQYMHSVYHYHLGSIQLLLLLLLALFLCIFLTTFLQFSSVQFSHSVASDSLRPHESQHARPPCPSPSPGVHSDSCPSSQWCHPAISSSVFPFFCPQSLPASESFPISQLFAWGGQSTGVSASASFLPKKHQGWSPSEWTGWISLQSKGLSRVFSNATAQKYQFFNVQLSSQSNSHIHTCVRLMVNTLYIKVKNQVTVPSASQKNCPNGTIEMSFLTSKCHTLSESRKTHGDHH